MTYREMVRGFLRDPVQQRLCPDGCTMSMLCLARRSGQTADGYITYYEGAGLCRLHCAVWASPREGKPILLGADSLGGEEFRVEPFAPDPQMVRAYQDLYVRVRDFAFAAELTAPQLSDLRKLMKVCQQTEPPERLRVMKRCFPDVFEWSKTFCE